MKISMHVTLALAAGTVLLAQNPPEATGQVEKMKIQVVAGGAGFGFVGGELIGGSPVKGVPYSAQAVTETTQTLADGNRIARRSASMLYRDSEGRERREMSLANLGAFSAAGEPAQTVFISDPVAGTNYTLETKSRVARKMPLAPPLPSMISSSISSSSVKAPSGDVFFQSAVTFDAGGPPGGGPPGGPVMIYRANGAENGAAPAPAVEQLGTTTIEGVQAQGTRTTITIPAGQIGNDRPIAIVSERWYSPELKVTVLSKHSDPRMGETVYSLTNISRAEPLRSLFEVPPDYTLKDLPEVRRIERNAPQP